MSTDQTPLEPVNDDNDNVCYFTNFAIYGRDDLDWLLDQEPNTLVEIRWSNATLIARAGSLQAVIERDG